MNAYFNPKSLEIKYPEKKQLYTNYKLGLAALFEVTEEVKKKQLTSLRIFANINLF